MHKPLVTLAAVVAFLGMLALSWSADARRGGGMGRGHAVGHVRAAGRVGGVGYRGGVSYRGNVTRGAAVNRSVSRNVNRNVNVNRSATVNRNYVYRNGRRGYWRNGVWIAAPLAAGAVSGYVATCAYEYRRWQDSGSDYWRNRSYQCAQ